MHRWPFNPHATDVAAARAWTERGGGGWLLCGGGGGGGRAVGSRWQSARLMMGVKEPEMGGVFGKRV